MAVEVRETEEPRVWQLWRVQVERRYMGEAYIWAPTKEAAERDADELDDDIADPIFGADEVDIYVGEASTTQLTKLEQVWTGGPDGEWVPGDRWVPPDPEKVAEEERLRPWKGQADIFGNVVGETETGGSPRG